MPGRRRSSPLVPAIASLALLGSCGDAPAPQSPATAGVEEPVVNVYNWTDYIDPSVLERFSAETGIAVNYDTFDSNEVLESKLLTGRSGYDVVVITATFMENQIRAGVYRELDPAQLPNLKNLDPALARKLAPAGSDGRYSVPYHWGSIGVGYDANEIRERLPDAPLDSLAMVFDPRVIAKFQDCGFAVVDSPVDVLGAALTWLGRDPNSEQPADLAAAESALLAIRPFVRYVNTPPFIADLANGEICIVLGWSGAVMQARNRAREAGTGADIRFTIPKEGAVVFSDGLAITSDAPHPRNAHRFVDFLLRADVAAQLSMYLNYPNANAASWPLVDASVRADPSVYPSEAVQARLVSDRAESPAFRRLLTRTWTRFRTGR